SGRSSGGASPARSARSAGSPARPRPSPTNGPDPCAFLLRAELWARYAYIAPMARLGSWIKAQPEGIYVEPADAWIDPSQPKGKALITHGHSDHARGGHGAVLATAETLAIMEVRCGPQNGHAAAYDETIRVGEVDVRFVPAGHVLGSAQIVLEHVTSLGTERVVVSGDYKRRPDPTCA